MSNESRLQEWSEEDRVRLAKEQVEVVVTNTARSIAEFLIAQGKAYAVTGKQMLERRDYTAYALVMVKKQEIEEQAQAIMRGVWREAA